MTDEVKAAFDEFVAARKERNLQSRNWAHVRSALETARKRESDALEKLQSACYRVADVSSVDVPAPKNPEDFFDEISVTRE